MSSWIDVALTSSVVEFSSDASVPYFYEVISCKLLIKSKADMLCNKYACAIICRLGNRVRTNINDFISLDSFIHLGLSYWVVVTRYLG